MSNFATELVVLFNTINPVGVPYSTIFARMRSLKGDRYYWVHKLLPCSTGNLETWFPL